ncbi:hypothetical protein ONS96_013479 [Cadophora gregata f. sp. sojae]|nr:hypothetical protein ONS96_013479 [Cadophora gregata f. sp. sojae]
MEGPFGTIKLIKHAKLWILAKELGIEDLASILLGIMDNTEPGEDTDKGNALKDFQATVYMVRYRELEDVAISKTLSAMNNHNIIRTLKNMPDEMRNDFTLAMMKGCVTLTGWSNGLGFEGEDLSGREYRVRRRKAKLGDKIEEAPGEKIAYCSENLSESGSDGESFHHSDDEIIPETELLDHDETLDNYVRIG